jgi:hypothetical protein
MAEVARPPGYGFLLPHQIYHEARPSTTTNPAAAAAATLVGGGPGAAAVVRTRDAARERHDGSTVAPPRGAAPAAGAGGGGPRRVVVRRMPAAPHEFYDGSVVTVARRGVPAAAGAVAGLPRTTVAAGGGGGEEEEDGCGCAVCLEAYACGDALRTMPCAHAFHEGCIVEWLSVSPLCPLCRFRLPSQDEEDRRGRRHGPPPAGARMTRPTRSFPWSR